MQNLGKFLSKTSKILVFALITFSLLFTNIPGSSAITPNEFIQKILKEAGQENTNTDKFIIQQEISVPSEQPLQNQDLQIQSETVQLQIVPTGIGLGTINTLDEKIKSCTTVNTKGCSAEYPKESNVTLIVSPSSGTTIIFPAECISTSQDTCTLTLDTSKLIPIQLNAQTAPVFATYLVAPYPRQVLPMSETVTLQANVVSTIHTVASIDFFVLKKGTTTPNHLGNRETFLGG